MLIELIKVNWIKMSNWNDERKMKKAERLIARAYRLLPVKSPKKRYLYNYLNKMTSEEYKQLKARIKSDTFNKKS